jgi:hypothetical protein
MMDKTRPVMSSSFLLLSDLIQSIAPLKGSAADIKVKTIDKKSGIYMIMLRRVGIIKTAGPHSIRQNPKRAFLLADDFTTVFSINVFPFAYD